MYYQADLTYGDGLQDGETYTVTVDLDDKLKHLYDAPDSYTFVYHQGDKVLHIFTLKNLPPAQVNGKVVDENGRPLANVNVELSMDGNIGIPNLYSTANDGSFQFRGLRSGKNYAIIPRPMLHRTPTSEDFIQVPQQSFVYNGTPVDLGAIKLPHVQLTGRLKDSEGNDLHAMAMLKDAAGNIIGSSFPYENGYFGVGGMEEGKSYTLTVLMVQLPSFLKVTVERTTIELPKPQTFVYTKGMSELSFVQRMGSSYLTGVITTKDYKTEENASVIVDFLNDDGSVSRTVTVYTGIKGTSNAIITPSGQFKIDVSNGMKGRIHAVSADGKRKSKTYDFTVTNYSVDIPRLIVE